MIEEIRGEIRVLKEQIEENNARITTLEHEINELESLNMEKQEIVENYEEQIRELEQKDNLVTQIAEIAQTLSVDQLQTIINAMNNPGETPAVHVNVQAPERVIESAEDVRYEDLTQEMHDAMLTIVGVRHQVYYRELNKSPEIGDIVTLHKETDSSNTYAVLNGHTIGVMPAGPTKIEQLENIGANYRNNQELTPDSDIINQEYEVVGVIPGCFVFLNPKTTITLETETPDDEPDIIGTGHNPDDARNIFRERISADPSYEIVSVVEENNRFLINYLNHNSNTTENYRNTCIVLKE